MKGTASTEPTAEQAYDKKTVELPPTQPEQQQEQPGAGANPPSIYDPSPEHAPGETEFDRPGHFADKTPCWICLEQNEGPKNALFRPCLCNNWVHQQCLNTWRRAGINPRNFFRCPNCHAEYRFKVNKPDDSVIRSVKIAFALRVMVVLSLMFAFLVIGIGCMSVMVWALDRENKNIPVTTKYIMTSVISGFPNSNQTQIWREEFKRPDVATWPYYTLFGAMLWCIVILILFCLNGCSFDDKDEEDRSEVCACGGDNGDAYIFYCYCMSPAGECPDCDGCGGGGGDCNCGECNCDCSGDGSEVVVIVVLIVVIIVVVIILFSACFVIVGFTMRKLSVYYDKYKNRVKQQVAEDRGVSEVVDRGEPEYTGPSLEDVLAHGAGATMV